ncbi:MAG: FecR domain-containing protein [Verrucomicrobiota bacterium]
MSREEEQWHKLITKYLSGDASEDELAELEETLRQSSQARRLYHEAIRFDSYLRREAEKPSSQTPEAKAVSSIQRIHPAFWSAVATIAVLLSVLAWSQTKTPSHVATLVSNENAAWESALPTTPGSALTPGRLDLKAGIATVRFNSGAKVHLEAPAILEIETTMKARLLAGSAVIDVPEPAIGFIIDTPSGYAVDHGTQFAVSVDQINAKADFEVLDGEISVHLPDNHKSAYLDGKGEAATVSNNTLRTFFAEEEREEDLRPNVFRLGTDGRSGSVVRNNRKTKKRIQPQLLTVKSTDREGWDHRSFFTIDLEDAPLASSDQIYLRLNLVPRGWGFAYSLPKVNRFDIYGFPNASNIDWQDDPMWEDAPQLEEGLLLGSFEVPRSQERGSFGIGTAELRDFVSQNQGNEVTFLIVREFSENKSQVPGLTHAFASDYHAEAAGPSLEFTLSQ